MRKLRLREEIKLLLPLVLHVQYLQGAAAFEKHLACSQDVFALMPP
jgi:hypothetical protein